MPAWLTTAGRIVTWLTVGAWLVGCLYDAYELAMWQARAEFIAIMVVTAVYGVLIILGAAKVISWVVRRMLVRRASEPLIDASTFD